MGTVSPRSPPSHAGQLGPIRHDSDHRYRGRRRDGRTAGQVARAGRVAGSVACAARVAGDMGRTIGCVRSA